MWSRRTTGESGDIASLALGAALTVFSQEQAFFSGIKVDRAFKGTRTMSTDSAR